MSDTMSGGTGEGSIELPRPDRTGSIAVETALARRRSVREFLPEPLTLAQVSQLLWAAQGVSSSDGRRTAPSAGACYPLETYLVAGAVEGLESGLYRFIPAGHVIEPIAGEDLRERLARAALGQEFIDEAPVSIVLAAVYDRTTSRYGERGFRYVHMDIGHAGENVHLQAVALGLGTVMVGAFDDEAVKKVLGLPPEEQPLYIMPVGKPR